MAAMVGRDGLIGVARIYTLIGLLAPPGRPSALTAPGVTVITE
jgi:hypothetical protein